MMRVLIKYCGGCNPVYDRVRAVQDLKVSFPETEFVSAGNADLCLVVCGCQRACAQIPRVDGMEILILCKESDFEKAKNMLH